MERFPLKALLAFAACAVVFAADWPTQSGSPQRNGWARSEKQLTKDSIGGLDLLYKYRADNQSVGPYSLTSPIIAGMLITYRGFKEMLVFGGSSDNVYSVDADLNRLIWERHFDSKEPKARAKSGASSCPAALTASVAMPGSSSASRSFARRTTKGDPNTRAGQIAELTASGFGRLGVFFAVSSDGYLHLLNTSTGEDLIPAVRFLPPHSDASSLNVNDNVVYAATLDHCNGNPNALYALDLASQGQKPVSFDTGGSGLAGRAGTAIGSDGTVYAQIANGHGASGEAYHDTVVALDPKTLAVKDYFTPSSDPSASNSNTETEGVTPVVFSWQGKDVVVAGARDGRLYLLSAASLGGADHHTPLSKTEPIAGTGLGPTAQGLQGAFASWQGGDPGTRWIYASLSGPANAASAFSNNNGDAPNGSIVAFKIEQHNGHPSLQPAWISRDMVSPAPVATANGLVFALSTGDPVRQVNAKGKSRGQSPPESGANHATLYVLDGSTGKELYSSREAVTSYSHRGGLAVANGRIYFTTHDNTVYSFGFLKAQPQLTER
jgi:WD40 repeat protein